MGSASLLNLIAFAVSTAIVIFSGCNGVSVWAIHPLTGESDLAVRSTIAGCGAQLHGERVHDRATGTVFSNDPWGDPCP